MDILENQISLHHEKDSLLYQTDYESFPKTSEICCALSAILNEQIVNLCYSSDQCLLQLAATCTSCRPPPSTAPKQCRPKAKCT